VIPCQVAGGLWQSQYSLRLILGKYLISCLKVEYNMTYPITVFTFDVDNDDIGTLVDDN
jgi:hypothetical protein